MPKDSLNTRRILLKTAVISSKNSKNPACGGGVFTKLEGCFEEGRTYSLNENGPVRLHSVFEYSYIIIDGFVFCVNEI